MGQAYCIIGIDIGTTTAKVIAFDSDGRELLRASREVNMLDTGEPGAREQDVTAVYQAVMEALREVVSRVKSEGRRVRAVGFSAAMHSLLAVDEAGNPLTGAMTWMDVRADAEANALWASEDGKSIYQRTGTPIHPMSPLVKLLWLRKNRADVFQSAAKFVSMKEWIWHQWFGEWVVDASMASATGLLDIRSQSWDRAALALAGIDASRLGEVVSTQYVRYPSGSPLFDLGFDADTAFNIGSSDGVLANLGAGVIDTDSMVITIGTSCALRVGVPAPVSDLETRPFSYILADGRYIVGGPSNSGGVVIEQFYEHILRQCGESDSGLTLPEMLDLAGQVDASDLLCLPYVAGERAPLWNAQAKAALLGLSVHHSGAHVLRAAVEGVLLNAYWIAKRLMDEVGKPKRLVASGKLLEVDWIAQTLADIFGVTVQSGGSADASTVGAAMLAKLAIGESSWDAVKPKLSEATWQPDAERHAAYQRKFAEFQRVVRLLGMDKSEVACVGNRA
jgi:gluconokinase